MQSTLPTAGGTTRGDSDRGVTGGSPLLANNHAGHPNENFETDRFKIFTQSAFDEGFLNQWFEDFETDRFKIFSLEDSETDRFKIYNTLTRTLS